MKQNILEWARPHDETLERFQVFGERRTGTNYVSTLLKDNLGLQQSFQYGWKHGHPVMPAIAKSSLMVVVVRDPLTWLASLNNRPFAQSHNGLGFSEFLRTSWHNTYDAKIFGHKKWGYGGMPHHRGEIHQTDRHPITGKPFANPLEMRAIKNACFLSFFERECNVVVVDYAAANDDPTAMLKQIAQVFEIEVSKDISVPDRVGPKGTSRSRMTASTISIEDLEFIRANLDEAQEDRLGYLNTLDALLKERRS